MNRTRELIAAVLLNVFLKIVVAKDFQFCYKGEGYMSSEYSLVCKCDHTHKSFEENIYDVEKTFFSASDLTISDCETVYLYESHLPIDRWRNLTLRRIGNLSLALYFPTNLMSLKIENTHVNQLDHSHFVSTVCLDNISIKNSVILSVESDTFQDVSVKNINFHNVTFYNLESNSFSFKSKPESEVVNTFTIRKCTFKNIQPEAINVKNASFIAISESNFSMSLNKGAIYLHAKESIKLSSNSFQNLYTNSIWLSTEKLTLAQNHFSSILNKGMIITQNNRHIESVISNNTVKFLEDNGVMLQDLRLMDLNHIQGNVIPCDGLIEFEITKWTQQNSDQFTKYSSDSQALVLYDFLSNNYCQFGNKPEPLMNIFMYNQKCIQNSSLYQVVTLQCKDYIGTINRDIGPSKGTANFMEYKWIVFLVFWVIFQILVQ